MEEYSWEEECEAQQRLQNKTLAMWADVFETVMLPVAVQMGCDLIKARNARCMEIWLRAPERPSHPAVVAAEICGSRQVESGAGMGFEPMSPAFLPAHFPQCFPNQNLKGLSFLLRRSF